MTITDDREAQERLVHRVLERPELLLSIAEHAVGKPRQSLDVYQQEMKMSVWPGSDDIAEE